MDANAAIGWIPAALALLGVAILLRTAAIADALRRQHLLAEQGLTAGRADTERTRAMLMGLERALSARIADTRHATEQRVADLTTRIVRDQGESRVILEQKLRELSETSARQLADIRASVNAELHQAVEKQMQASFARVIEQFSAVQKAVGDVQAVAAQIGDLKRIFSNVKTRGGWGEAQLRAVLDDVMPDGYVMNAKLREGSADMVEFALRMPGRDTPPKLLPLDAKFPLADYERMLAAAEAGDADAERAARRALESRFRLEARKIADKYLSPPVTTDFAVMYLPSDGLYAEAARIPGLIDELGRTCHVLLMGPSLLPALLRTVRLGYVTLALEEKAGQIGRLLGATKQEMLRMDQVLDRLSRNASTMAQTIEDARRRTRVVGARLQGIDMPVADPEAAGALALCKRRFSPTRRLLVRFGQAATKTIRGRQLMAVQSSKPSLQHIQDAMTELLDSAPRFLAQPRVQALQKKWLAAFRPDGKSDYQALCAAKDAVVLSADLSLSMPSFTGGTAFDRQAKTLRHAGVAYQRAVMALRESRFRLLAVDPEARAKNAPLTGTEAFSCCDMISGEMLAANGRR